MISDDSGKGKKSFGKRSLGILGAAAAATVRSAAKYAQETIAKGAAKVSEHLEQADLDPTDSDTTRKLAELGEGIGNKAESALRETYTLFSRLRGDYLAAYDAIRLRRHFAQRTPGMQEALEAVIGYAASPQSAPATPPGFDSFAVTHDAAQIRLQYAHSEPRRAVRADIRVNEGAVAHLIPMHLALVKTLDDIMTYDEYEVSEEPCQLPSGVPQECRMSYDAKRTGQESSVVLTLHDASGVVASIAYRQDTKITGEYP
jgi:hypothetical protein